MISNLLESNLADFAVSHQHFNLLINEEDAADIAN